MAEALAELGQFDSWFSNWPKLKVAVIGLGKTGFSAADTLNELGSQVLVLSTGADPEVVDVLDVLGIESLVSKDSQVLLDKFWDFDPHLVIVSPGIIPTNPVVSSIRDSGVPIWSDIDLAWRIRDKFGISQEWIVVTGTNGKTTTTELTEAMLLSGGYRAVACGNIGKPILDAVRNPAAFEVLAVELSSFQLHYLGEIAPFSAAVLNVADDHLDWHGDFESYKLAKGKAYQNVKVACVYNLSDSNTRELVEQAEVQEGARAIGFSLGSPGPSNVGYVEDLLVDRAFLEERSNSALEIASLEDIGHMGLLSPHLLQNIAAATALARSFGVAPAACREALRAFRVSAHRIELVKTHHGIQFVDDSKATNAHAADASLSSFESVVWIIGGLLKGQDVAPLIRKHSTRLRGAVVIGLEREPILAAFREHAPNLPLFEVTDTDKVMTAAVSKAIGLAKESDTVLLAPAAASMDQFSDYEERGNKFREAVMELTK